MAAILLIDDSARTRQLVGALLRDLGHVVSIAESGKSGLAILTDDRSVDLVVCDVVMPDMDGQEVVRQLKTSAPELPIIILSAHSDQTLKEQLLSEGVVGFLEKPVQRNCLASMIEQGLNNQ